MERSRTIAPQRPPLLVENELQRAPNPDVVGQFFAAFCKGRRIAMRQIVRPSIPGFQFVHGREGIEEDKIVEPPGIFCAEDFRTAVAPSPEAERRNLRAASNSSGIFWAKTRSYSTGAGRHRQIADRSWARSIQPWSARRSRLISSGFPANADVEE